VLRYRFPLLSPLMALGPDRAERRLAGVHVRFVWSDYNLKNWPMSSGF